MDALFVIGVAAYAACTVIYLASLWAERVAVTRVAHGSLLATTVLWTGLLGVWPASGVVGTRLYLAFSAWGLGLLYLLLLRRYPIAALGSVVSALSTVLAIFALLVAKAATVAIDPHLSGWLLRSHVGLAFVGIIAFAFATAVSIVYLAQSRMLKRKRGASLRYQIPPLDMMDRLAFRGILVGFPFYTVALLLGSVQALRLENGVGVKAAYILSGISWFIYGVVLQARLMAGWRGRRAAILTVAGMAFTLAVLALYSLGMA